MGQAVLNRSKKLLLVCRGSLI